MKKFDLSVIIPFFKINYLEETLNSLSNQINKNFKVYIGDDCSDSNCIDLVSKYPNLDISYHRFEFNLGRTNLVAQWKRCIDLVDDSEWFLILGDDDVLSNNFVEQFYSKLALINELDCSVVKFKTCYIDQFDNQISGFFEVESKIDATKSLLNKISGETRSSLSEHVFRKDVLLNIGFYPFKLGWHSDDLGVFEMSRFKSIFGINEAFVKIRVSSESITGGSFLTTEKNQASFAFFHLILEKHSNKFLYNERMLLVNHYETFYKLTHHSSIKNYLHLVFFYFKYLRYVNFLRIGYRYFIK